MKVLAALSGGVDSAVAAAMAVEAGHDVTGVHMVLSQAAQSCASRVRGCSSAQDTEDARRAAEIIGIPYEVWDLSDEFEDRVISDFLSQYRAGHTPNPCVRCNEFVKFRELAERARELGFDAVCTGHYARILEGPEGPELHRGLDEAKDQSYVLAVIGPEELKRVVLPLGAAPSKAWVRGEAERRGLGVSNKPDSFDICFIPDGDTAAFLRQNLGERPGEIVDAEGNVVGEHRGSYQFTVGQRKGLNLGRPAKDGKPRYVVSTDPKTNTVLVGPSALLTVTRLTANVPVYYEAPTPVSAAHPSPVSAAHCVDEDQRPQRLVVDVAAQQAFGSTMEGRGLNEVPDDVFTAQIRAHGTPSVVTAIRATKDGLEVDLAEPIRGVAAGQALVLYKGSRVVAEATLVSASHSNSAAGGTQDSLQ